MILLATLLHLIFLMSFCLAQAQTESEKDELVSLSRRFYLTFESETLEGQWDIWSPKNTDFPSGNREEMTKWRARRYR